MNDSTVLRVEEKVKILRTHPAAFHGHGGWVAQIKQTFGRVGTVVSSNHPMYEVASNTIDMWVYPRVALRCFTKRAK